MVPHQSSHPESHVRTTGFFARVLQCWQRSAARKSPNVGCYVLGHFIAAVMYCPYTSHKLYRKHLQNSKASAWTQDLLHQNSRASGLRICCTRTQGCAGIGQLWDCEIFSNKISDNPTEISVKGENISCKFWGFRVHTVVSFSNKHLVFARFAKSCCEFDPLDFYHVARCYINTY